MGLGPDEFVHYNRDSTITEATITEVDCNIYKIYLQLQVDL